MENFKSAPQRTCENPIWLRFKKRLPNRFENVLPIEAKIRLPHFKIRLKVTLKFNLGI